MFSEILNRGMHHLLGLFRFVAPPHINKQTNIGSRNKQQKISFVEPDSKSEKVRKSVSQGGEEKQRDAKHDRFHKYGFLRSSMGSKVIRAQRSQLNQYRCDAVTVNSWRTRFPTETKCWRRRRSRKREINSSMSGSEVPYHSSV